MNIYIYVECAYIFSCRVKTLWMQWKKIHSKGEKQNHKLLNCPGKLFFFFDCLYSVFTHIYDRNMTTFFFFNPERTTGSAIVFFSLIVTCYV